MQSIRLLCLPLLRLLAAFAAFRPTSLRTHLSSLLQPPLLLNLNLNLRDKNFERDAMGKRHNRKRTRSRPRNRNNNNNNNNNATHLNLNTTTPIPIHTRSESVSTASSSTLSPTSSCFQPLGCPLANVPANHWHQTYTAWQTRLRHQREQEQELETQRLRIFGGLPEDERCLMEPMLKVVTDLFDGFYDYEDP